MEKSIEIIQNIILPELEKDSKFKIQKTNANFWTNITNDVLRFEQDAKPVYAAIYSLELDNPEKIISKLPRVFETFIKALSENYVLGETSEATDFLLQSDNETFSKEVSFFKNLQQAVKSVERKLIKADLPNSYERLTFEISDADFENATKKKGREDLREKFRQWDSELVEERPISKIDKKQIIIILIAILIAFIIGLLFLNEDENIEKLKIKKTKIISPVTNKSDHVLSDVKEKLVIKNQLEIIKILVDTTQIKKNEIDEVSPLMQIKQDYKVVYDNLEPKIARLYDYLLQNDNETSENVKHKKQYIELRSKLYKYLFVGKSLIIYDEKQGNINIILSNQKGNFYFYNGNDYFEIFETATPLDLEFLKNDKIKEEIREVISNHI